MAASECSFDLCLAFFGGSGVDEPTLFAALSGNPSHGGVEPVDGAPTLPDTIELRLAAEATKDVSVSAGGTTVTVSVGPEPRWVAVPVGGEPLDIVNNVGSQVFTDGFGADRGYLEPDTGQYDEPADVFAWCGGSVLMRPAYLADVGLFDERFFLYYEDTDLSWRGLSRGWRYRYVPEAVTRHIHAASTGEGTPTFQHYAERNRLVPFVGTILTLLIAYIGSVAYVQTTGSPAISVSLAIMTVSMAVAFSR